MRLKNFMTLVSVAPALLPGIWHFTCGTPEAITPVGLRELPPAVAALTAMPETDLPAIFTAAAWERTARGIVIRIPVGDDEEFYGLGLQLKSDLPPVWLTP